MKYFLKIHCIALLLLFVSLQSLYSNEWFRRQYSKTQNLRTLQCIDSSTCFAFVSDFNIRKTIVYRTNDQGKNWFELYTASIKEGNRINYVGHCYVVDTLNLFMTYHKEFMIDKSTDGGETFERIIFDMESDEYLGWIEDFVMFNAKRGVIFSFYHILVTDDGWDTYTVIDKEDYWKTGPPIFFLDSNHIVVNKNSTLSTSYMMFDLETQEWSSYYESTEEPVGDNTLTMYDLCFINDSVGFACGGQEITSGGNSTDIIWKTTNKGKSWKKVFDSLVTKSFALTSMACSGNHIAAIANWGKILESVDGGETWNYIFCSDLYDISTLIEVSGQYILASALERGIWRYEDPSAVWDMQAGPDIRLWSNKDRLHIDCPSPGFSQYNISISDISGRVVYEQNISSKSTIIDISSFAKAVYLYRISSGNRLLKSGSFIVGE